jgi:hypothetical protein
MVVRVRLVTLEDHARAAHEVAIGGGRLPTHVLHRRVEADRFGGIDPGVAHAVLGVVDGDDDRVAIDHPIDRRDGRRAGANTGDGTGAVVGVRTTGTPSAATEGDAVGPAAIKVAKAPFPTPMASAPTTATARTAAMPTGRYWLQRRRWRADEGWPFEEGDPAPDVDGESSP